MWIILATLCGAGILYYIIAKSMPPIVLGITILCGAGLLFYIIRLIRHKRRDNAYYRHIVEHVSDEELEAYERKLRDELIKPHPYTPGMHLKEPKVVSTEKVVCPRISGEVYTALVLIHEDGTRTVVCRGDCSDCEYGDVE